MPAGRPKKDKRQSEFFDSFIEDKDIAELLAEAEATEEAAKRNRQVKREVKKLVTVGYPDVINADVDGEHSPWVNCLGYRFMAKTTTTPERDRKAGKIPSREVWAPLDVHKADLFSTADGAKWAANNDA